MKLFLAISISLAVSSFTFGQTTDIRSKQSASAKQEIAALLQESLDAMVARDLAALDRLWADDYVMTHTGKVSTKVLTKAQRIETFKKLKKSPPTFESAAADDVDVRLYDNFAVVTSRLTWKKGGGQIIQHRLTTVWLKRKGRWQMIAGHA